LNFSRAAERVGIQQPPLSLQIRQLETEIGTALFRRLSRGVELTESGALLLERARRILDDVEQTKTSVQSRARGETGRMRLGFAGAIYFQPLIPAMIMAYRKQYPSVQSELIQSAAELGVIESGASRPSSHITSTLRPVSRSSLRLDCTRFR
jgi:DNA-binding transcriptional LysR family regulator